jgi:menaquinone-dependent protoporphyrinogen IX oxidase
MVMRRIARLAGGPTDTTRDHVYTDYVRLDAIVDQFVDELPQLVPRSLGV